jgi:hypothetical protein
MRSNGATKKTKIILWGAILFFTYNFSLTAEEIPTTLNCKNGMMEEISLSLYYDSNDDNIQFIENQTYCSIAFLFNEKSRKSIIEAVEKAEEWKNLAVENNVEEMGKNIPGMETVLPTTMVNYGTGWEPYGLMISYYFYILSYEKRVHYYFVINQKTINDLNGGREGTFYLFDVGSETEELKRDLSKERVAEYLTIEQQANAVSDMFN